MDASVSARSKARSALLSLLFYLTKLIRNHYPIKLNMDRIKYKIRFNLGGLIESFHNILCINDLLPFSFFIFTSDFIFHGSSNDEAVKSFTVSSWV